MVLAVVLAGCVSVPLRDSAVTSTRRPIETLTASLSLSYSYDERGGSASGFISYRAPDNVKVLLLSPFGTVLQECWINRRHIIIVDPGQNIAFTGMLDELPADGPLRAWRWITWLLDIEPGGESGICRNRFNLKESCTVDEGLVTAKRLDSGEEVRYRDHADIDGVMVPREIILDTPEKIRVRIVLDDVEVNRPLNGGTEQPVLEGRKVYPLSMLAGQ